jgi:hypothetical protein
MLKTIIFYLGLLLSGFSIFICGFELYFIPVFINGFPYLQFNKIIYDLSLGTISAYIFYFIIEYLPKKIAANKAHVILSLRLITINSFFRDIIAILNGVIKINEDNKIECANGKIYFKLERTDGKAYSKPVNSVFYYENVEKYLEYKISKLKEAIDDIIINPVYKNIDEKTSEILSAIAASPLIDSLLYIMKGLQSHINGSTATDINKNFIVLKTLYKKLTNDKDIPASKSLSQDEINFYNERHKFAPPGDGVKIFEDTEIGISKIP